jgi:hypothetical protein
MGRQPMAKTDAFRDQAAACLEAAQSAADAKAKLELLMLAVAWLDLADFVERPVPSPAVQLPISQRGRRKMGLGLEELSAD